MYLGDVAVIAAVLKPAQVDAAFFHEVLLVLGSDEVRRGDMNIPAAALEQLYKTYRLAKLSLAKMPTVIPSDLLLALVGSSFVPPLTELAEPSMLPAIAEAQLSSALEPIRTADATMKQAHTAGRLLFTDPTTGFTDYSVWSIFKRIQHTPGVGSWMRLWLSKALAVLNSTHADHSAPDLEDLKEMTKALNTFLAGPCVRQPSVACPVARRRAPLGASRTPLLPAPVPSTSLAYNPLPGRRCTRGYSP